MFGLTGLAARIVLALLWGLGTFILLLILGIIIGKFDASIGSLIEKFAAVIGLLVGLLVFFTGHKPIV